MKSRTKIEVGLQLEKLRAVMLISIFFQILSFILLSFYTFKSIQFILIEFTSQSFV